MALSRRNSMSLIETNQGDVEILSNNFIDKKLERLFFPLNLMQNLVLNPKYIIKQNRIKPNDVFNKFKIFLSMVIFVSVFAYRLCEVIFDENLRRYSSVKFLYFEIYSECFVYCTRSVVNCIVNLVQSKNFVAFVLTYQEIHRVLTYEHMIKFYIIRNWVYFSIVFGYYIVVLVLLPLIFERWAFHFDINVFTYIILDANLIYTIALLKHLNDKVKQWNIEVVRSPHRICSERMFQVYVQIFECYEIYKNVVQENAICLSLENFFRILMNIQVMIEYREAFFKHSPQLSILLYCFMIKTMMIQWALSLEADAFYVSLEKGQCLSEYILGSRCSDDQKKFYKNIIRLYRSSFSKISVCGFYNLDICQPLRVLELITNYTVALLQFAFL